MPKVFKIGILVFFSVFVYSYFGYELDRTHFYEILLGFSIAFVAYVLFVKQADLSDLSNYQFIGIGLRLVFLISVPSLSDDYFRFIWDGQLIVNGLSPFDYLPAEVAIHFPNKETLLEGMNSPQYYSIYPPIAQLIYYLGVVFTPNSILGSIISMRVIILLAEMGSIFILPKILKSVNLNPLNSLWYILNPLVIVELTGNLHFEGIMIFFLLAALFLIIQNKKIVAPILWALSAGSKLIPLIFLPVLFQKYKIKQLVLIYEIAISFFVLLWFPFYNSEMLVHFSESFNLYFKSFEFNASIYYVVRWVGFQITGYNIIAWAGMVLPKVALGIMLLLMMRKSNRDWSKLFESLLFTISIYYLFAFIVHPWYICTVLVLGVFTNYKFAVLWSFLAILSYWAYQTSAYQENMYLIAVEYIAVFSLFLFEFFRNKEFTTFNSNLES